MKNERGYTLFELLFLIAAGSVAAMLLGVFVKVFRWAWGF